MRGKALFLDHFGKETKVHKLRSMRPKRNAKPVLIVTKQVDEKIESKIW